MEGTTTQNDKFQFEFFNKFQTDFYKSVANFSKYSNYDINHNSFKLVNVMAKGYPILAFEILSIYGNILKFSECPDLIRALQHNFTSGFSRNPMKHVFFKQSTKKAKAVKVEKPKILSKKRLSKDLVDFPDHVVDEIQTLLFLDSKDYNTLKYTDNVQKLGLEIVRNFEKSLIKEIKGSNV